jgi:RND family efflux transporter MFP subunit
MAEAARGAIKGLRRVAFALLAGASLLEVSGCTKPPEPRPPARVQAAPLRTEVFQQRLDTVSSLEASDEIELAAQAGGRVQQVLVQGGDSVRVGQRLVVLDQTQLRADVAALQAAAESDAISYERFNRLVKQGAATALQRDEYRARAIGSQQALRARQADLAYKEVRAPISGVMGELSIKPGDVIQAGTPFGSIIRNDRLQARIDIPANQAERLARGQLVQLLDGVQPRPLAQGRIERIDPGVNSTSQTLLATAMLSGSNPRLRNGLRLRTRVILGAERQLAVPFAAVNRSFGQSFVFLLGSPAELKRDPGKNDPAMIRRLPAGSQLALQRNVRLGPLQGAFYPVLGGLKPSDVVILSGNLGLRHGSPVRVVR